MPRPKRKGIRTERDITSRPGRQHRIGERRAWRPRDSSSREGRELLSRHQIETERHAFARRGGAERQAAREDSKRHAPLRYFAKIGKEGRLLREVAPAAALPGTYLASTLSFLETKRAENLNQTREPKQKNEPC